MKCMIWHDTLHQGWETSVLEGHCPAALAPTLIKHIRANECILRSLESYRQVCLIGVGAKLCRTVEFPSLAPRHKHTSESNAIYVFQVFFPFHLMIYWQICDFVLLSEHCLLICEWRISSVILYHCCATTKKYFGMGGGGQNVFFEIKCSQMNPKMMWNHFLSCTIKMHAVEC